MIIDVSHLGDKGVYDVLKYSNYKVLKCYKLVFVKRVLTKNLGSIIILILFILYIKLN